MQLREPFNALSHIVATALAVAGSLLLVLTSLRKDPPLATFAFALFGSSMIFVYVGSTLYHSVRGSTERVLRFRMLDRLGIVALIAGSYAPYALITFRHQSGVTLLALVWGCGVLNVVVTLFSNRLSGTLSRFIRTGLYLAMGWAGVAWAKEAFALMPPAALAWLVAGGIVYSLGGLVYALKRPNPWPQRVGFHGLWHLLAMAGSACHFVSMWKLLGTTS